MSLHGRGRPGTIRRVMSQEHLRRRRRGQSRSHGPASRAGKNAFLVLLLSLLTMGFTIAAVLLDQPALAIVTGTGCVSLLRQLTRRLLS